MVFLFPFWSFEKNSKVNLQYGSICKLKMNSENHKGFLIILINLSSLSDFFLDRVSLCNPGWPRPLYVAQVNLNLAIF
jgi:hypothetical protein